MGDGEKTPLKFSPNPRGHMFRKINSIWEISAKFDTARR